MAKFPLSLLLCAAPVLTTGSDTPADVGAAQLAWERSVYTPGQDIGGGIAILSSGDIIVAGGTYFSGTGGDKQSPSFDQGKTDAWVVALDAAGKRKWDLTLGGEDYDSFKAVVSTPDDQLIAVGTSGSAPGPGKSAPHYSGTGLWVVGISADGTRLWDRTYHHGYLVVPRSVCRDLGNGCFVGGESALGFDSQGWLLHLDALGNLIWERLYGDDVANVSAVAFDPDGRLLLGGGRYVSTDELLWLANFWMARADPADGRLLWKLEISKGPSSRCRAVLAARDGGAIGVGHFESTAAHELGKNIAWIVKATGSGERLWDRELRVPPGVMFPEGIVETDDGGLLVTASGGDGDTRIWVIRLTPDGDLLWSHSLFAGTFWGHWNRHAVRAPDGGWLVLSTADGPSPDRANSSPPTGLDLWLMRFTPEQTFIQRDPPELMASRFLGSHLSTDGFRFSLIGTNGGRYVTERSTNLVSWEPFSTNTVSASDVKLRDSSTASRSHTHYRTRAVSLP